MNSLKRIFRFLEIKKYNCYGSAESLYYEEYKKNNEEKHVQVHAFINQMDLAYAIADIIISRAGASSVSELCIVGKPTIFIPSPNVAEDPSDKKMQNP